MYPPRPWPRPLPRRIMVCPDPETRRFVDELLILRHTNGSFLRDYNEDLGSIQTTGDIKEAMVWSSYHRAMEELSFIEGCDDFTLVKVYRRYIVELGGQRLSSLADILEKKREESSGMRKLQEVDDIVFLKKFVKVVIAGLVMVVALLWTISSVIGR